MNHLTDEFVNANLMGPNAQLMLDELCAGLYESDVADDAGVRICDLGCGKGLTSLLLADRTQAHIWACDLWISEEENRAQFEGLGFGDRITAVNGDALDLPFADGFFDAVVSVDAYHYFGREEGVIDRVARYVKPGGHILLAVPGLVRPLDDTMMEVFGQSWTREQMDTIPALSYWRDLLGRSNAVEVVSLEEMACFDQAWTDWLACDNEYARGDRAAMENGGRELMNLVKIELVRVG